MTAPCSGHVRLRDSPGRGGSNCSCGLIHPIPTGRRDECRTVAPPWQRGSVGSSCSVHRESVQPFVGRSNRLGMSWFGFLGFAFIASDTHSYRSLLRSTPTTYRPYSAGIGRQRPIRISMDEEELYKFTSSAVGRSEIKLIYNDIRRII